MTEAVTAPVEGQAVEGQNASATPATPATTQSQPWYSGAPDEVVGFLQNKGWTDSPLKVVDAYQNLEKFRGVPAEQLLKLPKDLSNFDELKPIYERLGRPESPEKYELNLPDGVQIDEKRLNLARQKAHELGLNNKQFQELAAMDAGFWQEQIQASQEQVSQKRAAELESLKNEWGQAFDERAELGRRFVKNVLPKDIDAGEALAKIEDAIGSAALLKMFANAADAMKTGEARIPDSGGERSFGYSPEQAKYDKQSLMNELMGDKERLAVYNQGKGADYEKMQRLMKVIAGVK